MSKEVKKLKETDVFPFGKYKDVKIESIVSQDPNYIRWFNSTIKEYSFATKVINEMDKVLTKEARQRSEDKRESRIRAYDSDTYGSIAFASDNGILEHF